MHCPKKIRKYTKNYYEKKHYDNITSKFELSTLESDVFTLKYIGDINRNILLGFYIKENKKNRISIVAIPELSGLELLLFDNYKNGYSNSFVKQKNNKIEIEEYKNFYCSKCSNDKFKISLFYEYIDEDILQEEGTKLFDYNNAFQWIRISLECCKCGKKYKNIVDYED